MSRKHTTDVQLIQETTLIHLSQNKMATILQMAVLTHWPLGDFDKILEK